MLFLNSNASESQAKDHFDMPPISWSSPKDMNPTTRQLQFTQPLHPNLLSKMLTSSKPTGADYNSACWTQTDGHKLKITS